MNVLTVVKRKKVHQSMLIKVCTVAPKPLQQIIKFPDPIAVKEPMDGTDSDDSLPSIPGNLESNDNGSTITISSDEDLEQSMI